LGSASRRRVEARATLWMPRLRSRGRKRPEVPGVVRCVPRLSLLLALVLLLAPATPVSVESAGIDSKPAHHLASGFRNLDDGYHYDVGVRMAHFLSGAFGRHLPRGTPLTVVANDGRALRANRGEPTLTWIGHSTFLVQLDGVSILTDPIWADRASPVSFAGPRRLVPPGLDFADLPPIDAVVISHDHYDHLDVATVERLAREHHPRFFVPPGLRAWFKERGI